MADGITISLLFTIALTLLMFIACAYDATRFIIPNWLNLALAVLYPVWVLLAPIPIDWLPALGLFGLLLLVGFALYSFGFLGAGDVKFLAVCGLYAGWGSSGLALVLYMALLGGPLSILLIISRLTCPPLFARLGAKKIPRIFTMGEPVPYGLAIAGAFLILLWKGHLPGMV